MQEVTVIIPNLNGESFLKDCLSSLREQTYKDFEVILVDNGSSDNSVSFVQENFPEVRIHRFTVNTGFCHAVNAGIRMSVSPYVILLNNDTVSLFPSRKFLWMLCKNHIQLGRLSYHGKLVFFLPAEIRYDILYGCPFCIIQCKPFLEKNYPVPIPLSAENINNTFHDIIVVRPGHQYFSFIMFGKHSAYI